MVKDELPCKFTYNQRTKLADTDSTLTLRAAILDRWRAVHLLGAPWGHSGKSNTPFPQPYMGWISFPILVPLIQAYMWRAGDARCTGTALVPSRSHAQRLKLLVWAIHQPILGRPRFPAVQYPPWTSFCWNTVCVNPVLYVRFRYRYNLTLKYACAYK